MIELETKISELDYIDLEDSWTLFEKEMKLRLKAISIGAKRSLSCNDQLFSTTVHTFDSDKINNKAPKQNGSFFDAVMSSFGFEDKNEFRWYHFETLSNLLLFDISFDTELLKFTIKNGPNTIHPIKFSFKNKSINLQKELLSVISLDDIEGDEFDDLMLKIKKKYKTKIKNLIKSETKMLFSDGLLDYNSLFLELKNKKIDKNILGINNSLEIAFKSLLKNSISSAEQLRIDFIKELIEENGLNYTDIEFLFDYYLEYLKEPDTTTLRKIFYKKTFYTNIGCSYMYSEYLINTLSEYSAGDIAEDAYLFLKSESRDNEMILYNLEVTEKILFEHKLLDPVTQDSFMVKHIAELYPEFKQFLISKIKSEYTYLDKEYYLELIL